MIYSIYPSHESSSSSTMDGPSGRKITTTTTKPSAFSRLFSNNNRKKQQKQPRIIMVENKHPTQTVICNVRHLPHPGLKSCSSLRSSSSQSTSEVLDGDVLNPGDQLVTIKPKTQRYINVMKDQVFLYVLFKPTSIDNDFMLAKSPERPLDASHEFYVIEKQDFKVGVVAKKVNFSYHHGQVHLGDHRPSATALTTKN